jgi:hypothetical protein
MKAPENSRSGAENSPEWPRCEHPEEGMAPSKP